MMQRAANSINTIASTLNPFEVNFLIRRINSTKRIQKATLTGSPMPTNQSRGRDNRSKIMSIVRVVIARDIPSITGRFKRKAKEVINSHIPVIAVTAYNDQLSPFKITKSTIIQIRLAEKAIMADNSHVYILDFFSDR